MEGSARLLGKPADATWFASRAATVRAAFNARFLVNGYYQRLRRPRATGRRTTCSPSRSGWCPETAKQGVVDSIAADVRAKGDTLNTGVLGTKYLLPVLTQNGYADLAYTLATQTKYPSWGYMIENGATSMWEHWALEARSRGHYFLGTVDDWFFHHVAGIQASGDDRAISDLTIAPAVTGSMEWAKATTRTPYGPVTSDWRNQGRTLELRVDVPVGARATVLVPARNVHAVTEGGEPVDGVDVGDAVRVTVGSGHYEFVSDERAALVGDVLERLDDKRVEKALKRVRAGDVLGAAEALAKVLRDGDAGDAQEAIGIAISDFLDLSASATVTPATVRPGDDAAAAVKVVNGARTEIDDVRATLTGLDGWNARPAEARIGSLRKRATGTAQFALTAPAAQEPGDVAGGARVTYVYEKATVTVEAPLTIKVVSALSVAAMTVAPSPARPGQDVTVTTTLRNAGRAAATGAFQIGVPTGWTAPVAQTVTVPAEGELVVSTVVAVPRNAEQSARDVPLTSTFRGATGSTTLRVELAPLPTVFDRIDLGNSASEQAHGLTAAPSSGTSSEAGLTRRYAGHLTPFSWFEFDLAVTPGSAFVLRVIETYDRAQTKRYKIYVDGQEVKLRTFSKGGGGTETYEFVVPAALATDDRVRVKFENQDDPAFYDPSIADVWAYRLE